VGSAGPAARRHGPSGGSRDRSLPRGRLPPAVAPPTVARPARSHPRSRAPPHRGNPVGDTRAPARSRRQVHPLPDPQRGPAAAKGGSLPVSWPSNAGPLFVRVDTQAPRKSYRENAARHRRASARRTLRSMLGFSSSICWKSLGVSTKKRSGGLRRDGGGARRRLHAARFSDEVARADRRHAPSVPGYVDLALDEDKELPPAVSFLHDTPWRDRLGWWGAVPAAPTCRFYLRRLRVPFSVSPSASICSLRTCSETVSSCVTVCLSMRTRSLGTARFSVTTSSS
jgi:hypothetical protein